MSKPELKRQGASPRPVRRPYETDKGHPEPLLVVGIDPPIHAADPDQLTQRRARLRSQIYAPKCDVQDLAKMVIAPGGLEQQFGMKRLDGVIVRCRRKPHLDKLCQLAEQMQTLRLPDKK